MRITVSLLLALALLAVFSSACTSSSMIHGSSLLTQLSTPQPTPRASDFPRGRFSAVSAPNMVVLAIENDGSFRIYLDNALLDSGKFYVSGPQVLVDSMACAEEGTRAARPAAYEWAYDNEADVLAFKPVVEDPCPERRQYLSEQYQPKYSFVNIPDRGFAREWLW